MIPAASGSDSLFRGPAESSAVSAANGVSDLPSLSQQIIRDAQVHASAVERDGRMTYTMRLDPPELGQIVVEMRQTRKGLSMHLSVSDGSTLELVRASLADITGSLQQDDSVFQQLNIDVTTGGRQHGQDSEEFLSRNEPSLPRGTENRNNPEPRATSADSGQVSFVA
ncbi:MAG: flagellar hook-length control protein FliK [Planctomycetaceae bacterium]